MAGGMFLAAAAAAVGQSQPATAPSPADRLAALTLVADARTLGHLREAPARAGRIACLLEYAHRLWPDGEEINRQRVDLYESAGDLRRAASAAEACLRRQPGDFALALRWLALVERTADKAEERIQALKAILDRADLPAEVRAAAAAELGALYLRQGDTPAAADACRQALGLDAFQPQALQQQGRLAGQDDPSAALERALAIFRGDPRGLQAVWDVAQRLQAAGLYDQPATTSQEGSARPCGALQFYAYAYALSREKPPPRALQEMLLVDYLNAFLDAGQWQKAVEFFEPLM
jgi:tetratricopeptide (TPR) repeat protein